jgi:purine-binding chemotaxis protein CheW
LPKITPVPYVPDYVRGVANLRGQILPLIDLRMLAGGIARPNDGRMLVVESRGGAGPSGFVVDSLGGIAWLDALELVPGSGPAAGSMRNWVSATVEHRDRALGILDLEKLFASPELAGLRNV